jgi:hypothetical protein
MKVIKIDWGRWGFGVEVGPSARERILKIEAPKKGHPEMRIDNETLCPFGVPGFCFIQRKEEK